MYVIEIDREDGSIEYGSEFLHEVTAWADLDEFVTELKNEQNAYIFQVNGECAWFVALPGQVGATRYRVVAR